MPAGYGVSYFITSTAIVVTSDAIEIQNAGVRGALPLAVVVRLRVSVGDTYMTSFCWR